MRKRFLFVLTGVLLVLSLFVCGCSKDSGESDKTLSTAAAEDTSKTEVQYSQDKTDNSTQNFTEGGMQEDTLLPDSTENVTVKSETSHSEAEKEPSSDAQEATYPVEVELDFSEFE